ncbi:MAG TPA: PilZ domain-containing protein [Candidatus Acidoferrum sp.]|nr:PilZ domain-containing protein [Candidatus Acidoferrum sp.]
MRRSGRIPKEIPIVLIGSDLTGRIFSEETKTVLLSLHGAGLLSRHKLSPEQEMVLRWPERNKEAEIRVVGQIGEDSGLYRYGVAFFDHVENFWEMEFPPPTPKEQELGVLTLICNVCQTFERVDEHSIEADVVATNDGVLRYCKRCGNSTIWKVGQPGAPPTASASAGAPATVPAQPSVPMGPPQRISSPPTLAPEFHPPSQPPLQCTLEPGGDASAYSASSPSDLIVGLPAPASRASITSPFRSAQHHTAAGTPQSSAASVLTVPETEKPVRKPLLPSGKPTQKFGPSSVNRRKYPRIKVNYMGLVRHPERGEEFVQCEDISRGGLRFKSTSRYIEQTLIEVAAPYSSGQAAIFVPARIVFVQELPEQNLFRYGVQYLQSDRPRGAF